MRLKNAETAPGMTPETFVLAHGAGPGLIDACAPYRAVAVSEEEAYREYFDSFDWRLHRHGLTLARSGRVLCLRRVVDDEAVGRVHTRRRLEGLHWWDLPDGPLRDALRKPLAMRALLGRGRVRQRVRWFAVLNADDKTVVRVASVDMGGGPRELVRLLVPVLLRGYDEDYAAFKQRLLDGGQATPGTSPFETAMGLAGQTPGDYSPKVVPRLDPGATGSEAARAILRDLFWVMQRNEAGMRGDLDTEFLHDFRVAIRRTRSALTQIKGVFPPARVARFGASFRDLGRRTGSLRDLDVYLLARDSYRALLPDALQPGLAAVFDHLQVRRADAFRAMIQALDAPDYGALKRDWAAFLEGDGGIGAAPNAGVPARELSRACIYRRYRRLIKRGRAIGEGSPDAELHRLRVDCKKLRYLLEFFGSLFPPDAVAPLVGQLKGLQDNLGAVNDLAVQEAQLLRLLDHLGTKSRRRDRQLTAAAAGGLIARLYKKRRTARAEFPGIFAGFSGTDQARTYRELFGGGTGDHRRGIQYQGRGGQDGGGGESGL